MPIDDGDRVVGVEQSADDAPPDEADTASDKNVGGTPIRHERSYCYDYEFSVIARLCGYLAGVKIIDSVTKLPELPVP